MSGNDSRYFGAIEAGGTKILCALSNDCGDIIDQIRIPTWAEPGAVVDAIAAFFGKVFSPSNPLAAIGVGSFGPLSLNPSADDYGAITATTKAGWGGFNWVQQLQRFSDRPIILDTDVNCAARAETLWGAGKGGGTTCYITVGTGIGIGIIVDGKPFGGVAHLEAGHIFVRRAPRDEAFAGVCPFHGDCLEGLASGPAIEARWGRVAESLSPDHPAWTMEVDYIAQLCVNLTYSTRPERIILGGGVMAYPGLLDRIAVRFHILLGGYDAHAVRLDPQLYIVPPKSGPHAGLAGALAMAHKAATDNWPAHGFALKA